MFEHFSDSRELGREDADVKYEAIQPLEISDADIEKIKELSENAPLEFTEAKEVSFGGGCSAGCAGTCAGNCSSCCADSCLSRCLGSYTS